MCAHAQMWTEEGPTCTPQGADAIPITPSADSSMCELGGRHQLTVHVLRQSPSSACVWVSGTVLVKP